MKREEFAIQSIFLNNEQALDLKQKIIDTIENFGVQNFEKKLTITLPEDEPDEPIHIFIVCEFYTDCGEMSQFYTDPPEPEDVEHRTVIAMNVQLFNDELNPVECKQIGEIEEQITNYFTI